MDKTAIIELALAILDKTESTQLMFLTTVVITLHFRVEINLWKMAKRRITQETFDAAVRENMEEFEMEPDEALREAVEQFESQGNVAEEDSDW